MRGFFIIILTLLTLSTPVFANETSEMICNDGKATFNAIGTDRLVSITPDGDISEEWIFSPEIFSANGKKFSFAKGIKSKLKLIWNTDHIWGKDYFTLEVIYTNGKTVKFSNCKYLPNRQG